LGLRAERVRGEGELVGEGDMTEYDGAREEGGRARVLHLRGSLEARDAASLSGAFEAAVCRADLSPYERVFAWYRLTRIWTGLQSVAPTSRPMSELSPGIDSQGFGQG